MTKLRERIPRKDILKANGVLDELNSPSHKLTTDGQCCNTGPWFYESGVNYSSTANSFRVSCFRGKIYAIANFTPEVGHSKTTCCVGVLNSDVRKSLSVRQQRADWWNPTYDRWQPRYGTVLEIEGS